MATREPERIALDDRYDYVTCVDNRPGCASCEGWIPPDALAVRGWIAHQEGPPTIGFWHPECPRPERP
ncbi:hypothetical protein LG634_18695 [Streptomyces bambusae]|uniref:hypothetical protein n=1 Tax=Streptomyces bambusae TaxID=1550616 RepID=UPI001CFD7E80|nr:hypothetical protein [Streptomyces bambusae]MCB5166864.1 hypothetical protein [Streptomyces bambusae]